MKKTVGFLQKAALIIFVGILLYLSLNSAHYTFLIGNLSDGFSISEAPDSRLVNLVITLGAIAVLCVIGFLFPGKVSKGRERLSVFVFLFADLTITGFFLVLMVKNTYIAPYWDQAEIINDAEMFIHGDYSALNNLYLHKFPQQLGLIFYEGIFLRIFDSYIAFQYLNVFFVLFIELFSVLIADELYKDAKIDFYTTLFASFFIPMYVYVDFIYGELPSIAACLLISYLSIKWMKTGRFVFILGAVASAFLFMPVRENIIIFLIAVSIVFILHSLLNKKLLYMLAPIMLIFMALLSNTIVTDFYSHKAEEPLNNKIPAVSWIAMGLMGEPDSPEGVGYYTGYNEAVWWYNGATTAAARDASLKDLKDRISYFKNDPAYMRHFFRHKSLEQWIEPTFDSYNMTATNTSEGGAWTGKLYDYSWITKITDFMNRYMSVFYVCALLYGIFALFKSKKPFELISIIAFIGGFLFSLIWEAKGRYTFPYIIFLFPFAAKGVKDVGNFAFLLITKVLKKDSVDICE